MRSNRRPLVEADGITDFVSLMVVVREDLEAIEEVLQTTSGGQSGGAGSGGKTSGIDGTRLQRLLITLHHERTHFLQLVASAIPLSVSKSFYDLYVDVARYVNAGQLDANILRAERANHLRLWNQALSPDREVTTIHLMEASAVTESFRAVLPHASAADFRQWLNIEFPDPSCIYRTVIDAIASRLGDDAAFRLTPRLCYVSLECWPPSTTFWRLLAKAEAHGSPATMSVRDLLTDESGSPLAVSPEKWPRGIGTPLSQPYLDVLRQVPASNRELTLEWLASPGQTPASQIAAVADSLKPPLLAGGGGGYYLGIAASDDANNVIALHALVGMMRRLLSDGHPYHPCEHRECHHHANALCNGMLPPSESVGHRQCLFHDLFGGFAGGHSTDQLMRIRLEAGGDD